MLKDSQIKERQTQIESHTKKIDLLTAETKAMRNNIADCRDKLKILETQREQLDTNILNDTNKTNQNRQDINALTNEVNKLKEELELDAFNKKVSAICEKATDFYTCITDRIRRKQEEYKESMSDYFNFIDPATVVNAIKSQIDRPMAFDRDTIALRTVKGNYDATTKELAEMRAKGIKPDIHMARNRLATIDKFIESDAIIHRWYKQHEQED